MMNNYNSLCFGFTTQHKCSWLKSVVMLLFFAVFGFQSIQSQNVAVTGAITGNGSYATLAAAFTAIGTSQAGANISITISGDTTEPASGASLGAGTWTSLTIAPSGGPWTVSGAVTAGTPLVTFNGADNVTINGGGNLTFSNTTVSATSGTSTLRLLADAVSNTFNNVTFLGSSTMATGTNGGVVWISTGTTTGNDNNSFQSCKFGPAGANLPSFLFYGNGSTSTNAIQNSGIVINNCEFSDYFLATAGTGAIYVTSGNTNWTISNNKIFQTATRTITASSTHYGIYVSNTGTTAIGTVFSITGNTIGYNNASGTGTLTYEAGTTAGSFQGIFLNVASSVVSNNSITGNVISNIQWTSTGASTLYGIATNSMVNTTAGSTLDISNNTVRNLTFNTSTSNFAGIYSGYTPSTTVNNNTVTNLIRTGSGAMYGIWYLGTTSTNVTLNGNSVSGLNFNNTSSTTLFVGIYSGSAPAIETLTNNTVDGMTSQATGSQSVYGMYNNTATTGNKNFQNNIVRNLSLPTAGTGSIFGIRVGYLGLANTVSQNVVHSISGGTNLYGLYVGTVSIASSITNVFQNKIYGISSSVASPTVSGLFSSNSGTTTTTNIYNNVVGGLSTTAASNSLGLAGMWINGGTNANVYYNTVRIPNSSGGSSFGSTALFAATATNLDLRNNIFVNTSVATGTGLATAYERTTTTLTTHASTSNNNLFFGSSMFSDGATTSASLGNFQTLLGDSRESVSKFQNPVFASTNGADVNFLNFANGAINFAGGNAQVLGAPYNTDFSGAGRDASFPDIGAFEFEQGIVPLPTISGFTPSQLCVQGGQTVTITGSNLDLVTLVQFNGISGVITGQSAGSLTAIVPVGVTDGSISVTNDAGTAVSAQNYAAAPTPTVTVSPNVTICSGTGTLLTANGASTYSWSPATGLSATNGTIVTASPTSTTTYTVTGTSAAGCINTAQVTVTVNQTPTAVTVNKTPASVCVGGITTLTATGGTIGGSGSGALGAGASTSSTLGGSMFPGNWGGAKTQYLIRAADLSAQGIVAGNLTSLAFEATTSGQAYPGFAVSIGNSAQTSMTSSFVGGLTQVFSNASFTPAIGVNTIVFTTPFAWDGSSNIIVSICWSTGLTTSTSSTVRTDTVGYTTTYGWNVDSVNAATVCGTTGVPSGGNTPVLGSVRPKFTFGYTSTVPTTFAWTGTGLFSDAAATVPYAGQNVTVVYSKDNGSQNYTATATSTVSTCSTTSNVVNVTPNTLPTITANGATICTGGSGAVLTANGATSYSWSPATGLSATTGSTVTANPPTTTTYTIIGTDGNGCQNSTTATVTVINKVDITSQPIDEVVTEGSNAIFNVAATGDVLSYQWQVNAAPAFSGFENIPSETSTSYSALNVTAGMNGNLYRCIVSGTAPCDPVISATAMLTVGNIAINAHPTDQTVCSNTDAVFTISATGVTTYQWEQYNGAAWDALAGQNTATLTLSGLSAANTGSLYRCNLDNGAVYSNEAQLTVYNVVVITTQPVGQTVCSNIANVQFVSAAVGSGVNYQWQVNTGSVWTNITNNGTYSGATTSVLTITSPSVTFNGYQYRAVVNGTAPCTSVNTNEVTLNVNQVVAITTQPAAVTQCASVTTAGFSVAATGTGLTYQWIANNGSDIVLVNDSSISGATTSNLTVLNPSAFNGFTFKCMVSGVAPCNAVTSSTALLTVNPVMGGVVTVGTAGTYPTLTAAVTAYNNAVCFSGPVVFSLTDANYSSGETFPIVINANDNAGINTLTIRPAVGNTATISGNSSSIIRLLGADYIVIDGSNNGTSTRNLSIVNTNTTSSAVVSVASVSASNGATNNVIKNTVITGGSGSVATIYGIASSASSAFGTGSENNDGLLIENNRISKVYIGISAIANSTATSTQDGLIIRNNNIGSDAADEYISSRGIQISYNNDVVISNNTIFNLLPSTALTVTGIDVGAGVVNGVINANSIKGLMSTFGTGTGVYGINFSSATLTTNVIVSNNMITDLMNRTSSTTSTANACGLRLAGGTNLKIYNNTINLFGSNTGATAGMSANIIVLSTSVTGMDIRNNILSNTMQFATTGSFAYNVFLSSLGTFTASNNNDYWGANATNTTYRVGYSSSTGRTTLADWQAITGGDGQSLTIAPNFVSPTDLHLAVGTNQALDNLGVEIAAVPNDFDGDLRSGTPDMGADEFTTLICSGAVAGTASVAIPTFCSTGSTTVSATGYSVGVGTTYEWEKATDAAFTTPVSMGAASANYVNVATGTLTVTTYYRLKVICDGGTPVYSNVTSVVIFTPATLAVTPNTSICTGGSGTTLIANGAVSYVWSPATGLSATTGSSVMANPTATTAYTVTAIDANGCTVIGNVTVTVVSTPSAVSIVKQNPTICEGSVMSLTANGGVAITPGTNTLGAGASTSTLAAANPFYGGYGGVKTQYLIRASELTALGLSAGNLNSIGLDLTTAGATLQGLGISIGNTALTTLTTNIEAGLTSVFDTSNFIPVVGINTFNFSTPFTWNGTSNIIISFCWSNNNTSNTVSTVRVDASGFTSSNARYADNVLSSAICAYTGNTDGGWVTTGSTTSTNRPKMVFNYANIVQAPITWSPISDLYTNAAATTAYTGGNALVVYTKPTAERTYTATATNGICSSNAQEVITPLARPVIIISDVAKCNDGSVTTLAINSAPGVIYTWSPMTELYTNAAATTPYTGGNATTLYAKPSTTTVYTITATDNTTSCQSTGNVTVTVNQPVVITNFTPLVNTISFGQDTSFSVTATGTGLTYHWEIKTNPNSPWNNVPNNSVYSGQNTNQLLIFGGASSLNGNEYRCVVSGTAPCAEVISDTGILDIQNIGIVTQPVDTAVCAGETGSIITLATSVDPEDEITYYWEVKPVGSNDFVQVLEGANATIPGLNFSGAELGTLSFTGATTAHTGLVFHCIINGYIFTSDAALTVNNPVTVTTQPVSTTICAGSNATFTIATTNATGYQWQENSGSGWNDIVGATTTSLVLTNPAVTTSGYQYRVLISGAAGCSITTSNAVNLIINNPLVLSQPTDKIIFGGETAVFTITSTAATSYQWQRATTVGGTYTNVVDGTPTGITYNGATTSSLSVVSTDSAVTGSAYYRCIVTNNGCSVISSPAQFTVNVYCKPTNSSSALSYFDAFSTSGGTINIDNSGSGFSTGGYGNFTNLNVSQLQGQTVNFTTSLEGTTVGVSVWVDWNQNGVFDASERVYNTTGYVSAAAGSFMVPQTAIPGSTRMRIMMDFNALNPANPCAFASGRGEIEDYTFTVLVPPPCSGAPVAGTATAAQVKVCYGNATSIALNGSTSGVTGLSYQWFSSIDNANFAPISGATSVSLSTTGALTAPLNYYYCVVTCANSGAFTISNTVTISVDNPQIVSSTPDGRCGTGTVTLTANGSNGTVVNWYSAATGGSLLFTGSNFTTPSISTTTTYYAEAFAGSIMTGARTAPANIANTTPSSYGLVFDVTSPFTLNSVDVFNGITSSGTFVIQLQNSAGTVLQTSGTFTAPAGTGVIGTTVPFTANLGWIIPVGTGYRLLATTGTASLVRESSLGGFPYAIGTVGSITNGYISGTSTNYYYFYNWKVQTGCSSSPRTAVTATVDALPAATISYAGTPYCSTVTSATVNRTGTTGGTYSSTAGLSIDSSTGTINPSLSTPGSYVVTYTMATTTYCTTPQTATANVVINQALTSTFTYDAVAYCTNAGTTSPIITGTSGVFTASPSGLSIHPSTGVITLGSSTPGTYTVTNTVSVAGCPNSVTNAVVTINSAIVITTQPSGVSILTGSDATFTVNATGTGLTYQWEVRNNPNSNWSNVPNNATYDGTATNQLMITGAGANMNGYEYRCVVGGAAACDAVTSDAAILTVDSAAISQQPVNFTACNEGANFATFSIVAIGDASTYQWQVNEGAGFTTIVNGGLYSGADTANLSVTSVTLANNGWTYRCVVNGTVVSNAATLTVNTAIVIGAQPLSSIVCSAGSTSFTASATGTGVSYQWQLNTGSGFVNIANGGVYSNATTATLNLTNVTSAMNGYLYQVVVSGASPCGSVTSATATLTVNTAPTINVQPVNTSICLNDSGSIAVTASGTGLTYQWEVNTGSGWAAVLNGGVYSNATTATLGITGAPSLMNNYQYRVNVMGVSPCNPVVSNAVTLTIVQLAAPIITPSAANVCPNGIVELTTDLFIENFNVTSTKFTTSTVGTGTPSAVINSTYFAEGNGSVRFNTTSTSANVAYSLNSNVNLSSVSNAQLTFSHMALMEGPTTSYDFGFVEYSVDGGTNWVTFPQTSYAGTAASAVFTGGNTRFSTRSYADWITNFTGTGSLPNNTLWKTETFNIPAGAMSSQFRIRFRYTTDTSTNYYGWMIDNVRISSPNTIVWSPTTDLYTNAAATIPYTGGNASTVYAKPSVSRIYTVTETNGIGCSNSGTTSLTVLSAPTLSSITQPTVACAGSSSTFALTGMLPNSTSTVTYTVNNGAPQNVTGITANGSGNASMVISLPGFTNGQTLAITSIQRTDNTPSCTAAITANNTVTIAINPISVGGSVASNQNICMGTQPNTLVLSGNTGNVVRWEKSTNVGFTTVTTIVSTSTTLTGAEIGMLSQTTYFRAVVQNGSCSETVSNAATITVLPNPTLGTVTQAATVCSGAIATINLSGLIANSTSNLTYTINNGTSQNVTGIVANASGVGSFTLVLSAVNNGQVLEVTSIQRTDISPSCTAVLTGKTVTLTVFGMYPFYVDADGDGYGTGNAVMLCSSSASVAPAGYSVNNTDCNDSVASINPGAPEVLYNGVDDNCDGQLDEGFQITTTIQPTTCGTTLGTINSLIPAVSLPFITSYRFEVTNVSTSVVQTIDKGAPHFSLSELGNYSYATTYSIRVMVQRNGIWLGYYGTACLVSTPAILSETGAAQITPSQCGITIPTIGTLISTTSIWGATGYRFRVTNTITNQIQVIDRPLQWFALTMLPTYNYGTTYIVEVAVKTTSATYSGYGNPCNVSSPPVPQLNTAFCGATIATKNTLIATSSLDKVTSYRFEITNNTTGQSSNLDRTTNWFTLGMLPANNYSANTFYTIRVAVMTTGTWSPFGDACLIKSPNVARVSDVKAPSIFDVVASPNPFASYFGIKLLSESEDAVSIKVYDMLGKLVEQRTVNTTAISVQEVGERYPSGVYNVIVTQGVHVKTLRVIKR